MVVILIDELPQVFGYTHNTGHRLNPEIVKWLDENTEGKWRFKHISFEHLQFFRFGLEFELDSDATLFKS
jgi:hypothetical protein